jgi:hypothetical protein
MGCTSLTSLPESLGQLTGLQQLGLMCCSSLTSVPESLGQLTGLQQLDLWTVTVATPLGYLRLREKPS